MRAIALDKKRPIQGSKRQENKEDLHPSLRCAFRRWRPLARVHGDPPFRGGDPLGLVREGTIGELVISVLSGLVKRDAARPRSL